MAKNKKIVTFPVEARIDLLSIDRKAHEYTWETVSYDTSRSEFYMVVFTTHKPITRGEPIEIEINSRYKPDPRDYHTVRPMTKEERDLAEARRGTGGFADNHHGGSAADRLPSERPLTFSGITGEE